LGYNEDSVMAKQYVLCKVDPQFRMVVFVGGDPRMPTFYPNDPAGAFKAESIDEALACRSLMPYQLGGGAEAYHVHELLPDGQVIDVEPR
jgi:hypothetical protein